jgi:hypothetical protein
MATQPVVHQDSVASETIACISTTTCPDLFATSTVGCLVTRQQDSFSTLEHHCHFKGSIIYTFPVQYNI